MRTYNPILLLLLAGLFGFLSGCSESLVKTPNPNQPPQTTITSDTPHQFGESSYKVKIDWNGSDSDGRIAYFLIAWDDTTHWTQTTVSESTFTVTADSCASPPCSGSSAPFFNYHTFWVKAVDDKGAPDPTPAFRTFTATTVAPEVSIEVGPGCLCSYVSDYIFFQWKGQDPDGQIAGYWYKWDVRLGDYPTKSGPNPAANGWVFLPPESTSVASRRQQLYPGCSPLTNTFAVFAVDDAGAIEQVSRCPSSDQGGNWECYCPDSTVGGVGICIDGGILGTRSSFGTACFIGSGGAQSAEGLPDPTRFGFSAVTGVFRGTPVGFHWARFVSGTAPPLVGYRFAMDDPTALSTLSPNFTSIPDSIYALGNHALYVEAVDKAGTVDKGTFKFLVSQGPRRPGVAKRILLVDDNGTIDDQAYTEWRQVVGREPANWNVLLNGFNWDSWNTQDKKGAPGVPFVQDYTTIIWNCGIPVQGGNFAQSYLREQLFRPRADYLASYVRSGGNVLIVGMNPLWCMVIRSAGSSGGDECGNPPAKGVWMYWDPSVCGLDPLTAFPHLLFTRLGVSKMRIPTASYSNAYEQVADRTVAGCAPVAPGGAFPQGLFADTLQVDTLRAGGDTQHLHYVPAGNVTSDDGLAPWAHAIYYMISPDTTLWHPATSDTSANFLHSTIGILAMGSDNPNNPGETWGNTAFLGLNPYFLKTGDDSTGARGFFVHMLRDVFQENFNH